MQWASTFSASSSVAVALADTFRFETVLHPFLAASNGALGNVLWLSLSQDALTIERPLGPCNRLTVRLAHRIAGIANEWINSASVSQHQRCG